MDLSLSDTVARAAAMLERGEIAAAESILARLTASGAEENVDALQLMGLVRLYQNRTEEGISAVIPLLGD
jgi:hypothetical protein